MLSRVVGLSASDFLGLRPRPVLKTGLWLQNGPWRSSVLGTNRQAAILTSAKRINNEKSAQRLSEDSHHADYY